METLISLLLGVSLSAACGCRVFVTLLVVSAAANFGHLDLPSKVAWLGTDQALIAFAVASNLEVAGYYRRSFVQRFDAVTTPLALIAGTVLMAATAPEMSLLAQWTLAVLAGGGVAGLTKVMLNVLRIYSIGLSADLQQTAFADASNTFLSTLELIASLGLLVLSLTLPMVSGMALILVLPIPAYLLRRLFFGGSFWRFTLRMLSFSNSTSI